jgi:uncharacterized membrane protein
MFYLLSITGLFKMIFIIIGVLVVLRFLGQILIAKRNLDEQQKFQAQQKKHAQQVDYVKSNFGKVKITANNSSQKTEDVDYEEIV